MNDREPPRSLGVAIRARRQELGWSQEALAARVAAHGDATFRQSDVSRLERGKVTLPHRTRLAHLAAVLDLSLGELLARSGWTGAGVAFAAEPPTPVVDRSSFASVTDRLPVAPVPVSRLATVRGRASSLPRQESSHLRRVLVQAEATQARTKELLAQCEQIGEQIGALYERPLRARKPR